MSITSQEPVPFEEAEEPRVRSLGAPLSGRLEEPELPGWAQTGQPPRWPASWRVTPEKLRKFFGSQVYDSIPEPTVAVDDLFVGPTNHAPSQLWNLFIAELQRAASNSLTPRNLVTMASLDGSSPPQAVRCTACGQSNNVLSGGTCFSGCDT